MTVFFLIPGVVCLFLGVVFLLVYRHSSTKAEASERNMTGRAWAKLADTGSRTEYDTKDRAHTVYFGIYEYDTADGQHVSAASDFGYCDTKDVPGVRGNLVKARYNPNNPAEFALEEEQEISKTVWPKFKKTGMLLTALGILFAAAAVAAMLGLFRIPAFAAGAYGRDGRDLTEDAAIHCTEAARNMVSTEDLAKLIEMTKYSIEPQAVELLQKGFPAFEEAARRNQLGTQIGLEILYDESETSLAAVAPEYGLDDDDVYYYRYKIMVNTAFMAETDEDGNPVRDPETGKLHLATDRKRIVEYCSTITHEMMHAFMDDYNRSGMSGVIDPALTSLPAYAGEEEADAANAHFEAVGFPRWFTEGCATAVENEYAYRQEDFDQMMSYAEEDDGWCSPEGLQYAFASTAIAPGINLEELDVLPITFDLDVNIYVTGYLACLYLAELAANSEGSSACSFDADGFIRIDSTVLRAGLNDILSMLHEGVTLDDVIYSISEERFYNTADFEDRFVVADYDSAAFCSAYLNCMQKLSRENGRLYAPNGSLLLPFEADCATQIDWTKTGQSELYRIADSRDYVDSTADLSEVTDAGRSLSSLEYWSDAMTGTDPSWYFDGYYDGGYYDGYYNGTYGYHW